MREVFILASGPSLTPEDCAAVSAAPCSTLAVSDAYRLIEADYHYACDRAWWQIHIASVNAGRRFTQYGGDDEREWALSQGLEAIRSEDSSGLGLDCIYTNGNSGAQAINLAYLLGFRRMYLLGFDMQNTGGKAHFFGDHPEGLRTTNAAIHAPKFTQLAQDLEAHGVEVLNCTRDTALRQFKREPLSDVLERMNGRDS